MRKRSISLSGHQTSIRLEPSFWEVLDEIASARGLSLPQLVGEIDQSRIQHTPTPGLASALRVFALDHLKSQLVSKDV